MHVDCADSVAWSYLGPNLFASCSVVSVLEYWTYLPVDDLG